MKIQIVIHNPHANIVQHVSGNARDINSFVYNTLMDYGIDEKLAIDCASWAEIADYGDSYNERDFDVYIEDDELGKE